MRVLIFLLGLLVLLAGCTTYESAPTPTPTPTSTSGIEHTVDITGTGFSPSSLTVKQGDTVVFVNQDSDKHWPASDIHPTHSLYPESGGCIGSKFDACKGLSQGERFSFGFNIKGEWCYHDHLSPGLTGCITVQ